MSLVLRAGLGITLLSGPAGSVAMSADSTKNIPWKLHLQSRFSLANGKPLALWGGSMGYVWGPREHELTLGYQWLGARGTRQLTKIEKADWKRLLPHLGGFFERRILAHRS